MPGGLFECDENCVYKVFSFVTESKQRVKRRNASSGSGSGSSSDHSTNSSKGRNHSHVVDKHKRKKKRKISGSRKMYRITSSLSLMSYSFVISHLKLLPAS